MSSAAIWRTESQTGRQKAFAIGSAVLGLVLVVALRNAVGPGHSEEQAGLLLGVLLLVVGVGTLMFGGHQVITVEQRARLVVLERSNRFGSKRTTIPFSDITDVAVAQLGDKEGGSISYHLAVTLRSGKEVALFLGFFEGAHSRAAVEARREKLLGFLRGDA